MKAMMRSALLLVLVTASALAVVDAAQAQKALTDDQLRRQPGYVEFGDLWKWSDGDTEMEIHLQQPLLGVVGAFVGSEDPELSNLIKGLHLVKVNGFSFEEGDLAAVKKFVEDTGKKLRSDKWDNVVKVRERDEDVAVFVKFEGNGNDPSDTFLSGLAVLVLEEEKATFVNVVGRFRLEDIAKVGQHFDIPSAGDWERYNSRGSRSSDAEGKQ
jgi:hypothetical protein